MLNQRAPIITAGQLYLNDDLNEYMIVTKNERGQVTYGGVGFVGHAEDQSFIERFQPVNPDDVSEEEIAALLKLVPSIKHPTTGYILED